MSRIIVDPQPTPNPNAIKFNVNVTVVDEGSQSFSNKEEAAASPLAQKIFDLGGISSVFLLGNFVTVNKTEAASWNELVPSIVEIIEDTLAS